MKMTLKQAIPEFNGTISHSDAINTQITQARATEPAQYIGKRVYYNGSTGTLKYAIDTGSVIHGIANPDDIRPIPTATLDELKQAYCELNGVDDVEVEG